MLAATFRSMNQLKFFDIRYKVQVSKLIFFWIMTSSCFRTTNWKIFSSQNFFDTSVKNQLTVWVWVFLEFLLCFIDQFVYPYVNTALS